MATKNTMNEAQNGEEEARDPQHLESKPEGEKEGEDEKEVVKLYKSSRLKGYLTLILASSINFNSALQSTEAIHSSAVAAGENQQRYAIAVSMVTLILCVLIIQIGRASCRERV